MQQLSTANVLARMAPTERPCVHQALFETETLSHKELQERITTLVAAGRDGYYEALTRTLGSHDTGRVLDGNYAPSLLASVQQYRSPNGLLFTAATDKGIDYKNHNEDRVILRSDVGFAAVVDGMGGHGDGEAFAEALARELGKNPTDPNAAVAAMVSAAASMDPEAAACFASVRIIRTPKGAFYLQNAYRGGDVRIAIVNPDGEIDDESADENYADMIFRGEVQRAMDEAEKMSGTEEERKHYLETAIARARHNARFSGVRNVTDGGVKLTDNGCEARNPVFTDYALLPGAIVLVMSDGITDNLEVQEIIDNTPRPLTSEDILRTIDALTTSRMQRYEDFRTLRPAIGELFPDGFFSKPKRDNRGIAIIEVPR